MCSVSFFVIQTNWQKHKFNEQNEKEKFYIDIHCIRIEECVLCWFLVE